MNTWEMPDEEPEDESNVAPNEDAEDEAGVCSNCSGSGEGMYDGSICYVCHGRGTV